MNHKKSTLQAVLRFRPFLLMLTSLSILVLLAACAGSAAPSASMEDEASPAQIAEEVKQAPPEVFDAYQFALSNPDDLKNVPCYCGCKAMGHTSNYDCYIDEVKSSGEVVYDGHALGCSICVDITQDVMRMTNEGKTPVEIRAAIDQAYAQYGPSNFPPGK